MKSLIRIIAKTVFIVIPFWVVFYFAFAMYNQTFNVSVWTEVQRGNLMIWQLLLFAFAFIFATVHEYIAGR
jgi:hypothetical protein